MGVLATLASVGMAVGPPLVYADQTISIVRKQDSTGFSHDVCGVVIVANIVRIFFWLGERFETPLLVQSILLIVSQLCLLSICLHYAPSARAQYTPLGPGDVEFDADANAGRPGHAGGAPLPTGPSDGAGGMGALWRHGKSRPFGLWEWDGLGAYLEFLAGLIVVLGVLQVILGRWAWYINALGFVALSIESTLPIPQFIANYRRKSCHGFRSSTLAGWLFGDVFKTAYYFVRHNPLPFKLTGLVTIGWDIAVLVQRIVYGADERRDAAWAGDGADVERQGEMEGLRVGI
ncbi:hypothetical protein Q5752_004116 [Cryptotrichosporon argae]